MHNLLVPITHVHHPRDSSHEAVKNQSLATSCDHRPLEDRSVVHFNGIGSPTTSQVNINKSDVEGETNKYSLLLRRGSETRIPNLKKK